MLLRISLVSVAWLLLKLGKCRGSTGKSRFPHCNFGSAYYEYAETGGIVSVILYYSLSKPLCSDFVRMGEICLNLTKIFSEYHLYLVTDVSQLAG